jgi:hypothetical protein
MPAIRPKMMKKAEKAMTGPPKVALMPVVSNGAGHGSAHTYFWQQPKVGSAWTWLTVRLCVHTPGAISKLSVVQ